MHWKEKNCCCVIVDVVSCSRIFLSRFPPFLFFSFSLTPYVSSQFFTPYSPTAVFLLNFFSRRLKWYSVIFGHELIAYSSSVPYTPRPDSITSIIFPTARRHVPNREIHARHIRITDVLNVKTGLFPRTLTK